MIRTTRLALNDTAALQIQRITRRLNAAEEQAITGRRINAPSDDPGAVSEVHRLHTSIQDQEQYSGNAQQAQEMLGIMDGALSSVADLIVRAREIATAMAGDTVTAAERTVAAVETQALYDELVALANTDVNGRYLFSGTAYDNPAFNAAGVYQGNNDTPAVRASDSQWIQNGLDGSQVFQGATDMFASLTALTAALTANNVAGVQTAITDAQDATAQINQWRGFTGAETNTAEDAVDVSGGLANLLSERLNTLIAIDPTTSYLSLSELRNTYESTLRVASSATQTNLFDLL
jgi:flagellar hook-associated protein 3 FlgL